MPVQNFRFGTWIAGIGVKRPGIDNVSIQIRPVAISESFSSLGTEIIRSGDSVFVGSRRNGLAAAVALRHLAVIQSLNFHLVIVVLVQPLESVVICLVVLGILVSRFLLLSPGLVVGASGQFRSGTAVWVAYFYFSVAGTTFNGISWYQCIRLIKYLRHVRKIFGLRFSCGIVRDLQSWLRRCFVYPRPTGWITRASLRRASSSLTAVVLCGGITVIRIKWKPLLNTKVISRHPSQSMFSR